MKKIMMFALIGVLATVGCKSGKMPSFSDFSKDFLKAPEKKTRATEKSSLLRSMTKPTAAKQKAKTDGQVRVTDKIITIWKQSVLTSSKGAIRGFAGRVYFHGLGDRPSKVDGELTIYAFNDQGKPPFKETTAIKKFVFRRQDLPKHHSVSEVGDSYSVWLPFDQVGGPEMPLALMPIFRDAKTGKVVQGKQSVCTLRGTKKNKTVSTDTNKYRFNPQTNRQVKPVSYQSEAGSESSPYERKTITKTLSIPRDASAIKDSSLHKAGNSYRKLGEQFLREAMQRLEQNRQTGLNGQALATPQSQNSGPAAETENTAVKSNVALQNNGTTSRWEKAVQQFRGSRKPNSIHSKF